MTALRLQLRTLSFAHAQLIFNNGKQRVAYTIPNVLNQRELSVCVATVFRALYEIAPFPQ